MVYIVFNIVFTLICDVGFYYCLRCLFIFSFLLFCCHFITRSAMYALVHMDRYLCVCMLMKYGGFEYC